VALAAVALLTASVSGLTVAFAGPLAVALG
jgi:hypothetical protein